MVEEERQTKVNSQFNLELLPRSTSVLWDFGLNQAHTAAGAAHQTPSISNSKPSKNQKAETFFFLFSSIFEHQIDEKVSWLNKSVDFIYIEESKNMLQFNKTISFYTSPFLFISLLDLPWNLL